MAGDRELAVERARIERQMLLLQCLIALAFCVAVVGQVFDPRSLASELAVAWIAGYHLLYCGYFIAYRSRSKPIVAVEHLLPMLNISCITAGLLAVGDPNSPLWAIYLYALVGHTRRYTGRRYWSVAFVTIFNAALVRLALDRGLTVQLPVVVLLCSAMAVMAYTIGAAWRQAERDARTLAETDPLTGISNRRFFHQTLDNLAVNPDRSFALLMLDLDNFKRLNDQFGHQHGDAVLEHTARLLRDSVRAGDVVARYGGEEFIIAMPEATLDDARLVAERIRAAVVAQTPTSVSIGCAVRGFAESPDAVIRRADNLLLSAKRSGKNSVWVTGRAA